MKAINYAFYKLEEKVTESTKKVKNSFIIKTCHKY